MEKDNIQKELFEFQAPKKQSRKFGQLLQQPDFAISLNTEKLVFIAIGMILLLVVSFALGVERGKAISQKASEVSTAIAQAAIPAPAQPVQGQPAEPKVQLAAAETRPAAVKMQPPAKTYTIVAAAFSKEASAVKESDRLKSLGLEPFVYYSKPYYLVCAGSFPDKDSAQKDLGKVRKKYRDAYVKSR